MKKNLLLIAVLFALGGCAIIHKPAPSEAGVANAKAWQVRKNALDNFSKWSLQGRVATGQLLGWTGNLSWREVAPHFDVRLAGPLGAGGMHAQGTLKHVTIDTSDGKHFVTTDPDALVKKTLGWSFPLEPLNYWAKGLPAPGGYDVISVDDSGKLRSLTQDGWTVSYLKYTKPAAAPAALPRRIVLDNGDTRIRLVVDRWFGLGGTDANTSAQTAEGQG